MKLPKSFSDSSTGVEIDILFAGVISLFITFIPIITMIIVLTCNGACPENLYIDIWEILAYISIGILIVLFICKKVVGKPLSLWFWIIYFIFYPWIVLAYIGWFIIDTITEIRF